MENKNLYFVTIKFRYKGNPYHTHKLVLASTKEKAEERGEQWFLEESEFDGAKIKDILAHETLMGE